MPSRIVVSNGFFGGHVVGHIVLGRVVNCCLARSDRSTCGEPGLGRESVLRVDGFPAPLLTFENISQVSLMSLQGRHCPMGIVLKLYNELKLHTCQAVKPSAMTASPGGGALITRPIVCTGCSLKYATWIANHGCFT